MAPSAVRNPATPNVMRNPMMRMARGGYADGGQYDPTQAAQYDPQRFRQANLHQYPYWRGIDPYRQPNDTMANATNAFTQATIDRTRNPSPLAQVGRAALNMAGVDPQDPSSLGFAAAGVGNLLPMGVQAAGAGIGGMTYSPEAGASDEGSMDELRGMKDESGAPLPLPLKGQMLIQYFVNKYGRLPTAREERELMLKSHGKWQPFEPK